MFESKYSFIFQEKFRANYFSDKAKKLDRNNVINSSKLMQLKTELLKIVKNDSKKFDELIGGSFPPNDINVLARCMHKHKSPETALVIFRIQNDVGRKYDHKRVKIEITKEKMWEILRK